MPFGRPTEYKPELVRKVYDYVDRCVDTVEEFHKTRGDNSNSYERILKVKLPSMEGLACELMFSKDTLYKWAAEIGKEDFSNALQYLKVKQGEILLNNGLGAQYNPTIAKMLLSSHGYVEKTESKTDVTVKNEEITPEQARKILNLSNSATANTTTDSAGSQHSSEA